MTQITNAEKQIRFRKKEYLKRCADTIRSKWARLPWMHKIKISEEALQDLLDKAVDLPAGWDDNDYNQALQALGQIQADLFFTSDQLKNDIDADWDSLMTAPDGVQYIKDNKAAVERARTLAGHLISALKLSNCNDKDQAAALMDALRFVGRSLVSRVDVPRSTTCLTPRSQAVTICLAIIGPHYSRPDWFVEELASTLCQLLDKEIARQVGQRLLEQ